MTDETQRTCADCDSQYTLTAADQAFFERRALFLPRRCVACRQLRRLTKRGRDDSPAVFSRGTVMKKPTLSPAMPRFLTSRPTLPTCSGRRPAGRLHAAIGRDDVRALFNHDSNFVLGRTRAGTLRTQRGRKGLQLRDRSARRAWATDLRESISAATSRSRVSRFAFIRNGGPPTRCPFGKFSRRNCLMSRR